MHKLVERCLGRAGGQLLEELDAVVEARLPAGDAGPETLLLLVEIARSTRCHSRWMTARRRLTSGVTGTSHGAGESLRRALRCTRRRGAGVTRAPSR